MPRLLPKLLSGVPPTDPVTFGGVALVLCTCARFSCSIPSRRAMRAPGRAGPVRLPGGVRTADLSSVRGAPPADGRSWRPDEDQPTEPGRVVGLRERLFARLFFFFNNAPTPKISPLPLHDPLPI